MKKMNVEVSDPIDFNSGDHQHLVRNTADRARFIIKVFVILSVQLLVTAAIISMFVFWKALKVWVIANPWFTYVPANYILLGFFVIFDAHSVLLCVLFFELITVSGSSFYHAEEILWATAATTIVTLALTLFALQTKWDFTLLSGALFVFLFVLMIYGIVLVFVRSYWMHVFYAGLGTVLFSLYLVMDVQLMVGGYHHHSNLDPEEYVFAALNIYLDIINLFLFILQLIGLGR
uniref:Transmembrane BAX inhibitor motif containing 7 n=1 Tax=Jaculus jaculus TaxID=51337 RepID=A0A8C5LKX4_JACJA